MITANDLKKELKSFMDADGRLTQYPVKWRKKQWMLCYFASKLAPDKSYTEKELNALINEWNTVGDPCTVRRGLCDCGFLERERDGSRYWPADPQPDWEQFLTIDNPALR